MLDYIIYCGQSLSGLRETIQSFAPPEEEGTEEAEQPRVSITVLTDIYPYEFNTDDFALYLEEQDKGTVFACTSQFSGCDAAAVLMLSGQLLNPAALKYIDYFFQDSDCPLVFVPVLDENETMPEELFGLPPGGILSDFSLLLKHNFVCAATDPGLFDFSRGFMPAVLRAAVAAGRFGVLNAVSCAGKQNCHVPAMDLTDENMDLLRSYITPSLLEKKPALQITGVSNYYSDAEIEGFYFPECESDRLKINAAHTYFEVSRVFETVEDKLSPRFSFRCRLTLENNKATVTFKQNRKKIREIGFADECARNYTLAKKDGTIEIEKIAMRPHYKVSCVIPVYNAEAYLSEAVESVINQSLDFFINVQIILVNDGSDDNSHVICEEFAQKYYYNIVYVRQEHKGVSAARNAGKRHAMGDYVVFLDADDILDDTLLELGVKFLDDEQGLDFIAFPTKLFGEKNLPSPRLEARFKENGIVDIQQEPQKVQYSACGVVMRTSAIKGLSFNENMAVAEDAEFMCRALAAKQRYMVCKDAFYNYRIVYGKYDGDLERYTATALLADSLADSLVEFSAYAQNVILRDLKRVILDSAPSAPAAATDDADFDRVISSVRRALSYVDDNIILSSNKFPAQSRESMMGLKHGGFSGLSPRLYDFADVHLDYFRERNGFLSINGYFSLPVYEGAALAARHAGREYIAETYVDERVSVWVYDRLIHTARSFEIRIPLSEIQSDETISLYLKHGNVYDAVTLVYPKNYVFIGKQLIASPIADGIQTSSLKNIATAVKNARIPAETANEYMSLRPLFSGSRIWLFVDGPTGGLEQSAVAWLYEHCAGIEDGIDKRLVVSLDDMPVRDDNSIIYGSKTHTLMCLLAEKIFVSDISEIKRLKNQQSLTTAEFIFIPNDVLTITGKTALKALLGAPVEMVALISGEEKNFLPAGKITGVARVTGNPRYDALVDRHQPRILFMPASRSNLNLRKNEFNPQFQDSEYATVIGDLLLDERLLDAADSLGISVDFAPHEDTYLHLSGFDMDESIKVIPPSVSRLRLCQNAAMLITDTLPAHNFAYMGKPVVYFQFAGDGTLPQDGARFGESVEDFETLIDLLIEYMHSGFALKPQYAAERKKHFPHRDGTSGKRIYKSLTEGGLS
ncbi:MAG: glycosyltransferase [Defluviitaleaceae bacterium]|nr:glycosyltransferase [Defluviitaleaceae bacterium]